MVMVSNRGHRGCRSSTMMLATALLVSFSLLTSLGEGDASTATSREEQESYLKRFAYMGSASHDPRFASITDPEEIFRMAVMKFQMMAGINETGVVDEETAKMMEMPRCGLSDEIGMAMITKKRRRRRYAAQGSRWPKTKLTYRINNFSPDLSQDVIDSEIQQAFKHWSDVSPLTFVKVTDKTTKVDIDIRFVKGEHGDGSSFDGPGTILAHAFFPQYGGATHFDEDEQWTSKTNSGTNLLQVAIHEFGHALGLSHSDVQDSIMAPFYRGYQANVKLHSDDIAGIRYIYGSMMQSVEQSTSSSLTTPGSSFTTTTHMKPSAHAICRDPTVDAIFAVNEDVYVFKGAEYYMGHRGRFLSPARPSSADWPGLPDNVDTAVYVGGSIFFFKDQQYWRYNILRQPEGDNPRNISTGFRKLPSNIDAAFVWSANGRLYATKGSEYYRMSRRSGSGSGYVYRVDFGYPQPLRLWKGLPSKIDAAFNYTNGRTYFFNAANFYRYNDVSFKVDSGYPQPTKKYWLGCFDSPDSAVKPREDDMMEKEWMAGGDQFISGGIGLPTYSRLLATVAMLALSMLLS